MITSNIVYVGLREHAGRPGCAATVTRKERESNGSPNRFIPVCTEFPITRPYFTASAQVPDGTVKITRRTVSPGIGVEWGQGVLTYKGRGYPFSYRAGGTFREVDTEMTTVELSGQVFNLKNLDDFNGRYYKVETEESVSGGGSRVPIKNQSGVMVKVVP
jgi:hypothetical protein